MKVPALMHLKNHANGMVSSRILRWPVASSVGRAKRITLCELLAMVLLTCGGNADVGAQTNAHCTGSPTAECTDITPSGIRYHNSTVDTVADRKFNRMRPSMAGVLGLETRSAKAG